MALEYLFTGRCELTDGVGRGAEVLIRAGAKELEVSAIFESGDMILSAAYSKVAHRHPPYRRGSEAAGL